MLRRIALFTLLVFAGTAVYAQCVSLTTLGSPYTQDFNTLASAGTSSTVPTGWAFNEVGTSANTTYTAGTGSLTAGDTYSFGALANTERAFGGLFSNALNPTIGACFTNNTGVTVSNLTIAYTGEQWRLGTAARNDQLDFEYSLDATSLTTGTWTQVNALDFITPNSAAPTGAKDGNNAAFRTAISSSISPLAIANGATVWIRWLDFNASSADDGLAVDDFSITPSVLDIAPSVLTTTPPNGATGVTLGANIDITFSEPVTVAPGWFSISCTVSGLHAATESGGPTSFTLDPTVNFVANEVCTVTIDDLSVADNDANDPPDNMAGDFVWSFDTNPPPPLVINEIDYDQPGTDSAEFIEIRNNGGAPVNLDPVAIELVNGGGTTVYQTIDLPNVNLAPGAYYVICANNTTTPNCNLDVAPNTDLIQNGAPDAVALRWNGVLVDTVSYEGDTGAPYTETSGTGLTDNNADDFFGLSRLPDGTDTGVNNTDLTESCITPGAANVAATTPCSAPTILGLSINDVTMSEGNALTQTFTFTVQLDQPAGPGGVTFDITTADGTAQDDNPAITEDNDYVGQTLIGTANIPQNATQYIFNVTVNSDATIEPDENFFVNITNVVGAPVGDPQGVGTIQNDDFAAITPIHDIQGPGTSSPEVGNVHTIHGIVTGVKSNGFFVQEEEGDYDADPATSEGIFVFTSSAPPAAAVMGNLVYVTGTVAEFTPSSDPQQPPVTELTSPSTVLDLTGQALPAAIPLTATFPDPAGPFDQLERVEGMRVTAASITVSGPSDGGITESTNTGTSNGRFHGVVTGVPRPFREPGVQHPDTVPTGTIPPIPRWDTNPERLRIESATINAQPILTVKSGDVVGPVEGPLDYGFRGYAIYPDGTLGTPVVTPGTLPTIVTDPLGNEVTVATFNMFHFFDDVPSGDGSGTLTTGAYNDRLNKASIAIRNHLKFPDILGVQEVDSIATLTDLAAQINSDAVANSQPDPMYVPYLMEGNDVGGIDVGYLVKTAPVAGGAARVAVTSVTQFGLATTWTDPRDGSTDLLHDRPSLVLEATVNRAPGASFPIVVVNNHLKSLIGIDDNTVNGATTEGDRNRQKRREQAEDIALNLLQVRLTSNPNEHIVLIGDFNAFEFNDGYVDPISILSGTPTPDNETVVAIDDVVDINPDFVNLVNTPPPAERYSYVHDGNAQNLDHVIVSAGVVTDTLARRIERPRINADYPETERMNNATPFRISDHEPTVGYLATNALAVTDFAIDLQHGGYATAATQTTITLVVTNNGPDSGDATFAFPLHADMAFQSHTEPAGWDCTTPGLNATGTINCNTTTPMAPGTAAFTFIVSLGNLPPSTPLNVSATVDAALPDPDVLNDTDNLTITVLQPSQYYATKTFSSTRIQGQNVTYTITIFNNKPFTQNDAAGDELVDVLPSSLALVSATAPSGTAVANTGTNTVTWNGSIASGSSVAITITATIGATATGTVSNQATINDDFDNFDGSNERTTLSDDPGVAGTTDPTDFTILAAGEVTATKSVSGTFVQGTNVVYTIVITNNMSITQPNNFQHEFTDILPSGLTYVSSTASSGTAALVVAPDTFAWNGSIPPGGTVTITITCTINATASGTISNQGQTIFDIDNDNSNDSSHLTDDPSTAAVDDATSFVVIQANEVTATKSVSGTFVQGTNVTYTIVITNNMTVTQNDNFGHEFTDSLPSGLTFVSANATSGTVTQCCGNPGTVLWNGSIPSGGTVTITIVATIDATATCTISNQAHTIFDRDGDNANESEYFSDPASFNVIQANEVLSTMSVSGTFVQGTNVTYTVVMTNNMTVAQDDNFGHEWTDILPAGLTFVSATASSGTIVHCCGTPGIVFWDGSIPSGGSVTLTFTATIDATATCTISNQGQTIFNRDCDSQNESSHLTDDPNTAAVDDATSFVVIQANEVLSTMSVSGTYVQGTNVTYTVVLTNNMTVAQDDLFGHEWTDNLPTGITPVSVSASSGTIAICCGNSIVFWDGSIPAGGTVTLTITATIDPSATCTISNQGQTIFNRNCDSQNESSHLTDDPNTAAVDDPTSFNVVEANEVLSTMSVSGTFVQGTTVTYTVVMTNNMTVTQPDNFGHEWTNNLPAGITPVSVSASSGTIAICCGNSIVFWDGSIPAGGTVTLTINATINPTATGTISNQGQTIFDRNCDNQNESSHLTDDPSTAAVDDPTSFTVIPSNAYAATKSVSGTFVEGTNVTYTVTLANGLGHTLPDNAGDEFTDVLPASLTLVSATATSGTAVATIGTNTVTWNGAIPASGSVTITITATINAGSSGTVSNQGTTATDLDNNGSNETAGLTDDASVGGTTDPTTFTVVASNLYTAAKSVSGTFVAGTNVTYTVTLANGFAFALADNAGDEFSDVLPASLTLVSASATSGTAVATVGTNTVTWNGAIAASSSVTITIVATINPSATGTVSNQGTAAIDLDNNGSNETAGVTDDPSVGGTTDPTVFTVVATNAYTATKSVSGTFVAGSNITYTVTLTNGFAFALADNAGDEFSDVLPASLTLVSASATSGTAVATVGTNTVTWNGAIAASSSVTITITATINPSASGTISNQGTTSVDLDNNGSNETAGVTDDPSTGAANDATVFTVIPPAGLVTATKTASGTFVAGTNVTYTITLTNNMGIAQADNAGDELTDVLPASLTLVSASATSGTAVATIATNTVTWNGAIAAGASVTITITATINPSATGTISNQAAFVFDGDGNGTNEQSGTSNNESFTVVAANAYTATKTVSGTFDPGDSVTYTVTLTNGFSHAVADNAGDEFTDVLPSGLTLVSANATSGTATANTGTNTVTWNGSLAPSASVTITITATISATTGTISNQGTAAVDTDNNGSNETSILTDDPSVGGASDPTSFVVTNGDADGDGVPDSIEQAAPNGGDGNGDGIPDYTQATVASLPAATGSGYLTLQSSCPLQQVVVSTASSYPPDQGNAYPHGLIAFRAPCSSATFSLFVYGSAAVSSYRKFGPLPPGGPQQWYGIPATFQVVTVGSLHPRRIDFSLTDGGTGDDTPVDGVIVDQGGPAGPNDIPTLDEWMLIALAMMLAAFAAMKLRT